MKLSTIKKISVFGLFGMSFLTHFIYNIFPNSLFAIFFPVNESIWEHMKILFGSILFSGVIQKIIVKVKHLNYENVCISNVIASISSIPIFLIFYIPIYSLIGEKLLITILLMLITIIISQLITISIINMKKNLKLEKASILFIIIIYLIFTYLTYNPLKYKLFKDPINNIYGIKKES